MRFPVLTTERGAGHVAYRSTRLHDFITYRFPPISVALSSWAFAAELYFGAPSTKSKIHLELYRSKLRSFVSRPRLDLITFTPPASRINLQAVSLPQPLSSSRQRRTVARSIAREGRSAEGQACGYFWPMRTTTPGREREPMEVLVYVVAYLGLSSNLRSLRLARAATADSGPGTSLAVELCHRPMCRSSWLLVLKALRKSLSSSSNLRFSKHLARAKL